ARAPGGGPRGRDDGRRRERRARAPAGVRRRRDGDRRHGRRQGGRRRRPLRRQLREHPRRRRGREADLRQPRQVARVRAADEPGPRARPRRRGRLLPVLAGGGIPAASDRADPDPVDQSGRDRRARASARVRAGGAGRHAPPAARRRRARRRPFHRAPHGSGRHGDRGRRDRALPVGASRRARGRGSGRGRAARGADDGGHHGRPVSGLLPAAVPIAPRLRARDGAPGQPRASRRDRRAPLPTGAPRVRSGDAGGLRDGCARSPRPRGRDGCRRARPARGRLREAPPAPADLVTRLADRIERLVVTALLLMMSVVVVLATVELGWIIAREVYSPPVVILELPELLDIFGFFLVILIGLELLETVKAYLTEHVVHVELVVEVALIAVARKVIVLDVKESSPLTLLGVAAIILALAIAYHLQRRRFRKRLPG